MRSWLTRHSVTQCINCRWQHWFWTESQSRRLIGQKYNHYLDLYDQYPYKINRADVRRYFLMYEYGGVYIDLDIESIKSLNEMMEQYPCIIAQEPLVHQLLLYQNNDTSNYAMPAFMACRPNHPFLKLLIDKLSHYISKAWNMDWNDNILQSTGPYYVQAVLNEYQKHYNNTGKNYIHVAPPDWFMPNYDTTNKQVFKKMCRNRNNSIEAACRKLKEDTRTGLKNSKTGNEEGAIKKHISVHEHSNFKGPKQEMNIVNNIAENEVFTDHHWLHTWSNSFRTNNTRNVGEVVPGIKIVDMS